MPPFRRILVLEFISAGGLAEADAGGPEHAALLAQGRAMRDALLRDLLGIDGLEVACAVAAGDVSLEGSGVRLRPLITGETPEAFLRREHMHHGAVWIVAPETDGILAALHAAADNTTWIGCSRSAIQLTTSKSATRRCLRAAGLRVPDEADGAPDNSGPWVVKPDDGAGTVASRRHPTLAAARADAATRGTAQGPTTIERWVEGTPMSLSLLVTGDRAELLAVNRQDVSVAADGMLGYTGVVFERPGPGGPALDWLAAQLALAIPGLAGYLGVDLVMGPDGVATVIEVNPRLTCAYIGLSERLGRPLAAEILAAAATRTETDLVLA
ncbi:MAG: ATP-grasp domain-containing protein [Rhodocyclaceae bacterium]|nr:ATP-grasp domain-containing protein [Rhodocyclaceae bacterium]